LIETYQHQLYRLILRTALDDPDWIVRANAVQQLAQLEDPESLQFLLEALSNEDSSVQASAARVLGVRGQPEAREVCEHLAVSSSILSDGTFLA